MSCFDKSRDEYLFNESTSGLIRMRIRDENGDIIPASAISSITLTAVLECSPEVIVNGREDQDVFNDNGGTYDEQTGEFTFAIWPADTEILTEVAVNKREAHLFTFSVTTSNGRQAHYEALLRCRNLLTVE